MSHEKEVAGVIDLATYKVSKLLSKEVNKLRELKQEYESLTPSQKADIPTKVAVQIERRIYTLLPKVERRLEVLERGMRVVANPTGWTTGDSS